MKKTISDARFATAGLLASLTVLLMLSMFTMGLSSCINQESTEKRGAASSEGQESFLQVLDREVPRLLNRYDVPGIAIGLIRGGEIAGYRAYGWADLESRRPMETDTVFRAESISKSVSVWGVMRLVEEGLVGLHQPVLSYLQDWDFPPSNYDTDEITLNQIMSNSSGLPLGTIGPAAEYAPGEELPELKAFLTDEAVAIAEPGEGFIYSDAGFNLIHLLTEDLLSRGEALPASFSRYMEDQVLRPLGMTDSSFNWRSEYEGRIATAYEGDGTPVAPYLYAAAPSGGLFSTLPDLCRFVAASAYGAYGGGAPGSTTGGKTGSKSSVGSAALGTAPGTKSGRYTGGVISLESLKEIHQPRVPIPGLFGFVADSYGYGHFVETLEDGRRAVWHGGQGHGWMTHFHLVPEAGEGIVILTNSQRSWPLLAQLLSDWAEWAELGALGFGIIIPATRVLWGLILLIFITGVFFLLRRGRQLFTGRAVIAFPGAAAAPAGSDLEDGDHQGSSGKLRKPGKLRKVANLVTGFALIGLVIWRASLPYVFETSIFPGAVPWLAGALLFLGTVSILYGATVRRGGR